MSTELTTTALTNLARVKARLGLTGNANFDPLLERLIMSASQYIEQYLDTNLLETTYTNELYTPQGRRQIILHNRPVTALTSIEYRAGTVSNPSWTAYLADDYELINESTGVVYIYAGTHSRIRITYTAGYKIDFDNVADSTQHTLPIPIAEVVELIVVRRFRKRESEGKKTEGFEDASTTWDEPITKFERAMLAPYKRIPNL